MRCRTPSLVFVVLIGCGGDPGLPPPAISDSYYPITGTLGSGGPAPSLAWKYRINGAKELMVIPGITARYDDEEIRVLDGGTRRLATSGGNVTMTEDATTIVTRVTSRIEDHITPGPPRTIDERRIDQRTTHVVAKVLVAKATLMATARYSMPISVYLDRSDLAQLDIGHTETLRATATVTGSRTEQAGGMDMTQPISGTIDLSATWTVIEKLATAEVLGRSYADVVKVREQSMAIGNSLLQPRSDTTLWLARGVGPIRIEQTVKSLLTETMAAELLETNLVPSP